MEINKPYGYPQQRASEMYRGTGCCKKTTALPENPVAAMAYVPFQECNDVYSCEKALFIGTVFPVLDKPFLAGCCR